MVDDTKLKVVSEGREAKTGGTITKKTFNVKERTWERFNVFVSVLGMEKSVAGNEALELFIEKYAPKVKKLLKNYD